MGSWYKRPQSLLPSNLPNDHPTGLRRDFVQMAPSRPGACSGDCCQQAPAGSPGQGGAPQRGRQKRPPPRRTPGGLFAKPCTFEPKVLFESFAAFVLHLEPNLMSESFAAFVLYLEPNRMSESFAAFVLYLEPRPVWLLKPNHPPHN